MRGSRLRSAVFTRRGARREARGKARGGIRYLTQVNSVRHFVASASHCATVRRRAVAGGEPRGARGVKVPQGGSTAGVGHNVQNSIKSTSIMHSWERPQLCIAGSVRNSPPLTPLTPLLFRPSKPLQATSTPPQVATLPRARTPATLRIPQRFRWGLPLARADAGYSCAPRVSRATLAA